SWCNSSMTQWANDSMDQFPQSFGNGPLPSGWATYAGSCGALPMFTMPVWTAIVKSLLHVRKYLLLARSRFLRTSLVYANVVTIMKSMINKQTKFSVWYIFVAVWGVLLLHHLWAETAQVEQIPYSQFETYLNEGRIAEVHISQDYIQGKLKDPQEGHPQQFVTVRVPPDLADKLATHRVKFSGEVESPLLHDV